MAAKSGIFSSDVNFADRWVQSLDEMAQKVEHLRGLGMRIVLTSGSFDLIHLGHVKYLARAKELADVLVVGVDSDAKIRHRKVKGRPLVPQEERLELLAHQRPVDLIYLKEETEPRWALIKAVSPDVLVLSEDHGYGSDDKEQLLEFCGSVEVIERQAAVTTTERIRQMYMHMGDSLAPRLAAALPELIDSILQER